MNDVLLTFPEEVCALTRRTEKTERWMRQHRRTSYLWRSGKRLFAWKSDVIAYLEEQRLADQAAQQS
ncbi:hypothetical protein [Nonomuraea sp. NPDC023979]|uniref:hypothetical protein n=1 Tax=Nonomuraea sp. NPDC023979 TaxID=3154796 RepID=UPI00340ABABC